MGLYKDYKWITTINAVIYAPKVAASAYVDYCAPTATSDSPQ
jgi:hypothetical protein